MIAGCYESAIFNALFLPLFSRVAKEFFEVDFWRELDSVATENIGRESSGKSAEDDDICETEPEFPGWQIAKDAAKHQRDWCAWWEVAEEVSQRAGAVWHEDVDKEDRQNNHDNHKAGIGVCVFCGWRNDADNHAKRREEEVACDEHCHVLRDAGEVEGKL